MNNLEEKLRILDILDGLNGRYDESLNLSAEKNVVQKMSKTFDDFGDEVLVDLDLSVNKVPKINQPKSMFVFTHVQLLVIRILVDCRNCEILNQFNKVLFNGKLL